jgi:hypothetical protein
MDSPAQSKTPTNCPSSPSNREEHSNTDHIAHHEDITPKAEDTVQTIAPRSLLNLFESPHCLPAMDDDDDGNIRGPLMDAIHDASPCIGTKPPASSPLSPSRGDAVASYGGGTATGAGGRAGAGADTLLKGTKRSRGGDDAVSNGMCYTFNQIGMFS